MFRHEVFPQGVAAALTEDVLVRTIFLAIQLADPIEQADIVSRIVPEEDIAAERLQSRDVQNTGHRVILDAAERRAALREVPDQEEDMAQRPHIGECLVCAEGATLRVNCGCVYCPSCLLESIRHGLRSEADFPPRCFDAFQEDTIRDAGRPELVHLFRQLAEEVTVVPQERVYCYDGRYATFIAPDRQGHCAACDKRICVACGEAVHGGDCVQGEVVEDWWATMNQEQLVSCHECARCIQLSEACNHMR